MSEFADRLTERTAAAQAAWDDSEGTFPYRDHKHAWTSGYRWGYEVAAREAAYGTAPRPLQEQGE